MKRLFSLLLCLAVALSLCTGIAFAAGDGELDIDWMPDSLGDDPNAAEYSNVSLDPIESFAAEYPEEYAAAVTELEQWAAEDGIEDFDARLYLAEAMPMAASDATGFTTPSTLLAAESGTDAGASHYYTANLSRVAVPDQGSEAICWAVAAMDCLRIGEARDDHSVPALSADHLVHYSYAGFTDDLALTQPDYIATAPANEQRGNVYASLMTLASWAGPAAALDTSRTANIYSDNSLWLENGYWLRFTGSADREAVKEAIVEYGAVAASLYMSAALLPEYYNETFCAYCYNGTRATTNHEIVIVGWDDDYAATNFNADQRPAYNGAWLCRNTWGSDWGDGGYFWLSYYDNSLSKKGVGVCFDANETALAEHIYQYDGNYTLYSKETVAAESVTIANVFTASGGGDQELLRAVSTYALAANTSYTVEVYTALPDPDDPRSGTLAASASGVFQNPGYQTVRFDSAPRITESEQFSVVYTFAFPKNEGNSLLVCQSGEYISGGSTLNAYNSSRTGESFLLTDGSWLDVSDPSAENGGVNYRIKAFTDSHTHSWTDDSTTSPTCTEAGEATRSCSCGATEATPLSALGHTLSHHEAKAATITAEGNTEYWKCDVCGQCFSDEGSNTSIQEADTLCPARGFDDVPETKTFYKEVMWAVENGITAGMSATEFGPYYTCTREQIVTFLWRAAGKPTPSGSDCPFTDVHETDFFYEAVLWAVESGITNGMSATEFCPKAPCTRGQIVTFLWRAAGKPTPSGSENPFTDMKKDYYREAILWAAESGIAKGVTSTIFAPENACQRWHSVLFLYRAYAEE